MGIIPENTYIVNPPLRFVALDTTQPPNYRVVREPPRNDDELFTNLSGEWNGLAQTFGYFDKISPWAVVRTERYSISTPAGILPSATDISSKIDEYTRRYNLSETDRQRLYLTTLFLGTFATEQLPYPNYAQSQQQLDYYNQFCHNWSGTTNLDVFKNFYRYYGDALQKYLNELSLGKVNANIVVRRILYDLFPQYKELYEKGEVQDGFHFQNVGEFATAIMARAAERSKNFATVGLVPENRQPDTTTYYKPQFSKEPTQRKPREEKPAPQPLSELSAPLAEKILPASAVQSKLGADVKAETPAIPDPKEVAMNKWIEKVRENALVVKRHGKLNPTHGGFDDYGQLFPNPAKYSGFPKGVTFAPTPDPRPILNALNLRSADGNDYNPALIIRNVDLSTVSPNIGQKLIGFSYQCRQRAKNPREDRAISSMQFVMYFDQDFAREFASALENQTVPAKIIVRLYDTFFPPEKDEPPEKYFKYEFEGDRRNFQGLTVSNILNIFQAENVERINRENYAYSDENFIVSKPSRTVVPFII